MSRFLEHRAAKDTAHGRPAPALLAASSKRNAEPSLWNEFFLLSEAHACTFYKGMCGLAHTACTVSLRRQLTNGVMLEATPPAYGSAGKEPQCTRWSNGGY